MKSRCALRRQPTLSRAGHGAGGRRRQRRRRAEGWVERMAGDSDFEGDGLGANHACPAGYRGSHAALVDGVRSLDPLAGPASRGGVAAKRAAAARRGRRAARLSRGTPCSDALCRRRPRISVRAAGLPVACCRAGRHCGLPAGLCAAGRWAC